MSTIKLAQRALFTIEKRIEEGYLLRRGEETILMPISEAPKELAVGDTIEGFVYIDHKKRHVATSKKPLIDTARAGLVNVVEKKLGLGVFVDVGLHKDMLVSKDDLPYLKKHWPEVGDVLYCQLKSGKNQIVAKPLSRDAMRQRFKPETSLPLNEACDAVIFYMSDEGLVFFTEQGHEIFVHHNQTRTSHRIGERMSVIVTRQNDPQRYNGRLIPQKETVLESDAEMILKYLRDNGGRMPFTDKSSPDSILNTFHMSKSAFKRALGTLYRMRCIELKHDETVLRLDDCK